MQTKIKKAQNVEKIIKIFYSKRQLHKPGPLFLNNKFYDDY